MGGEELLSDLEKGQISAEQGQGLPNRKIARDLGRCHSFVDSYVRNPNKYGTKRRSVECNDVMNGNQVLSEVQCPKVYRLEYDRKSPFIAEMRKASHMTQKHRNNRDSPTLDQDNDYKDYAAIAGMPEDPAMKDVLQMMAKSTTAPQEALFDSL
ncbi:unnamed protein product [Haemonchus placei]|uniref:HTH_Tnp_Tc3_1 domain-containing protein n=1 Tax=Haemonchus placei TaxID=6290 RepID=A0A0N4W418_HAEPC|nr:unnamed protein product [Haemonchus placei]